MAREDLIDMRDRPVEEQKEIMAAGGRASGVARRKRRTFRESLKAILQLDVSDPDVKHELLENGLDPTILNAISLGQAVQAQKGNTEAARFVRDTVGEKPREGLEIGNLDDRPLATIDMSKLSDDELRAMMAARAMESDE